MTILASAEGGTEIEEVAARRPEKIISVSLDPIVGYTPFIARKLAFGLGLETQLHRPFQDLLKKLVKAFWETDASLIEINPLVINRRRRLFGRRRQDELRRKRSVPSPGDRLPGRLQRGRPPGVVRPRNTTSTTSASTATSGPWSNGAGLAMATMDLIKQARAEPAQLPRTSAAAARPRS